MNKHIIAALAILAALTTALAAPAAHAQCRTNSNAALRADH